MNVYVDTSFLVSLYVTDQNSAEARDRILSAPPLWFTPLHDVEWVHAISQNVFRGRLSDHEARQMHAKLHEHKESGRWLLTVLPDNVFGVCANLARTHGSKLGMRTLDSLHVACALELNAERFWTYDERQAKLARAQGLKP